MNNNIEIIETSLNRLVNGESSVYFLVYDTKGNPRASIKYIYDLALTLKENGFDVKLLSEDKNYRGVSEWLDTKYESIPVYSIKDDKIQIRLDDTIVIPEYYSNVLEQLVNIRCTKIMLVQQKEYIYETLPIGSTWSDYGFDKVITTTDGAKKYILDYFPNSLVFVIPPIIEDIFEPVNEPVKPYVAISCRDRVLHKKFISEFYLKYPQLRWITFRDMVQMSYVEFANSLKECMVSVWMDDDSTFGTFPLESMKCGVPVVGKIPNTEPDWLGENGMWTYDTSKMVEVLATYILAWLEGVELTDEIMQKMKETLLPYDKNITLSSIVSIFNSFKNKKIESLQSTLKKLKEENS
jgi:glycosyltransferase involved in cell wall biosynthesis